MHSCAHHRTSTRQSSDSPLSHLAPLSPSSFRPLVLVPPRSSRSHAFTRRPFDFPATSCFASYFSRASCRAGSRAKAASWERATRLRASNRARGGAVGGSPRGKPFNGRAASLTHCRRRLRALPRSRPPCRSRRWLGDVVDDKGGGPPLLARTTTRRACLRHTSRTARLCRRRPRCALSSLGPSRRRRAPSSPRPVERASLTPLSLSVYAAHHQVGRYGRGCASALLVLPSAPLSSPREVPRPAPPH